jgi:hypothetical protein
MEIVTANSLIISWRPGYKKIQLEVGDEYFVKFVHRGQDYAVSCIEIIRAIFTTSMVIANQLLTTDGFFSMIKNCEVDGDKTEFTLEDKFCRITKNSETLVKWILSHDALQEY